jgi:transcriptional repressor NrdR
MGILFSKFNRSLISLGLLVKCPYCQSDEDKVVDSRSSRNGKAIRRRRECLGCGRRYTTYEYVETTPIIIVKSDGRREPYDRVKILEGLKMACTKRPISAESIELMADNIENQLQTLAEGEISAKQIGELAMRQLYQVDEVAYIRFASVYRKFKEVKEFLSEIKALEKSYG